MREGAQRALEGVALDAEGGGGAREVVGVGGHGGRERAALEVGVDGSRA
jgi:hypothetical protein